LARHARAIADGNRVVDGAEVLNDVVFTQVCAAFGADGRDPGRDGPADRRRDDVDVGVALARPGQYCGCR
jgi:hypothetical protein